MPDGGSTLFVPAAVGKARAFQMALLGERVPAAQALEWGLVNQVHPDAELLPEAEALVERMAKGPTRSYAGSKRALNRMLYALGKNWGLLLVRGLCAILFGIIAFVVPGLTVLALLMMYEGGFRHVPVVEKGRPVGMVSARDELGPELAQFQSELDDREHIGEILG